MLAVRGVLGVLAILAVAHRVAAQPPPPLAEDNRLAIDAWLGGGLLVGVGASLRYERGRVGGTTGVVRFEVVGAADLADSRYSDRNAFSLLGGGRYYFGTRGYVVGELGVAVLRYPGHDDFELGSSPTTWGFGVAGRLGIGARLGRVDLGIAVNAAALGVGVYLGGDFAIW